MNKPELKLETGTEQIRIRGLVQGVGFRPTVYRVAKQMGIKGTVINDGEGVLITAQASSATLNQLIENIQQQCPPLARIDEITRTPFDGIDAFPDFRILSSQHGQVQTAIVPDAATCPACLQDINSADNRRHGYAFTNCTHCGPRLSIVRQIPYDRANTSMASFNQCGSCQQEYDHPEDRRFHAQPNACPDCGPFLRLTDRNGQSVLCENIIDKTAELINQGAIIAIKGIGGYQLACDASNHNAVTLLRERKHRPAKAFALMASSTDQVKQYCELSHAEKILLESTAAPIVVLKTRPQAAALSTALAPGQNTLGLMLPYSPLHHLLMQRLQRPIVLTSGNASEEPQCIDNQQALDKLSQIADYFILHNRDIINRIDDSVVRVIDDRPQFYRRARGYAPAPLLLDKSFEGSPRILAMGGELKNSFCLLESSKATLSQHMGNLENHETYQDYLKNLDLFQQLFEFEPDCIVIDKHPEYLSSKLGKQWAEDRSVTLIEVQHHHAHIAACLADNHWPIDGKPVIGVAMDGLGLGEDGTIWGGEFLVADYRNSQRHACFKPVPLPGATQAILEPWRNLYAHLTQTKSWKQVVDDHPQLRLLQQIQKHPVSVLQQMIDKGLNSPLSSSCGRLFDAFAAAVDICSDRLTYEGQAPIELEALITSEDLQQAMPYPFTIDNADVDHVNTDSLWYALFNDLQRGCKRGLIAANLHVTLVHIMLDRIKQIHHDTGLDTVALSGGVFQNATLLTLLRRELSANNFRVLLHQQVPANDGGLSLGQAAIAAAHFHQGDS